MKIYYLGNGFDLFHKLPTRYFDFKIYFKNNFSGFYNKFIKMYGLGERLMLILFTINLIKYNKQRI